MRCWVDGAIRARLQTCAASSSAGTGRPHQRVDASRPVGPASGRRSDSVSMHLQTIVGAAMTKAAATARAPNARCSGRGASRAAIATRPARPAAEGQAAEMGRRTAKRQPYRVPVIDTHARAHRAEPNTARICSSGGSASQEPCRRTCARTPGLRPGHQPDHEQHEPPGATDEDVRSEASSATRVRPAETRDVGRTLVRGICAGTPDKRAARSPLVVRGGVEGSAAS